MANKIIKKAPIAVKQAKKAINFAYNKNLYTDYEVECFSTCFSTTDQKEGMSAFIDKRNPQFKGK